MHLVTLPMASLPDRVRRPMRRFLNQWLLGRRHAYQRLTEGAPAQTILDELQGNLLPDAIVAATALQAAHRLRHPNGRYVDHCRKQLSGALPAKLADETAFLAQVTPDEASRQPALHPLPAIKLYTEAGRLFADIRLSMPGAELSWAQSIPLEIPKAWRSQLLHYFTPVVQDGRVMSRPCVAHLSWDGGKLAVDIWLPRVKPNAPEQEAESAEADHGNHFWEVSLPKAAAAAALILGPALPAAAADYTVKAGDTLSSIARAHVGPNAMWQSVFNANRDTLHNPHRIFPGMVLHLPGESTAAVPSGGLVVRPGDTLFKLAQRHLGDGHKWTQLWNANKDHLHSPNMIFAGTSLRLPGSAGAPAPTAHQPVLSHHAPAHTAHHPAPASKPASTTNAHQPAPQHAPAHTAHQPAPAAKPAAAKPAPATAKPAAIKPAPAAAKPTTTKPAPAAAKPAASKPAATTAHKPAVRPVPVKPPQLPATKPASAPQHRPLTPAMEPELPLSGITPGTSTSAAPLNLAPAADMHHTAPAPAANAPAPEQLTAPQPGTDAAGIVPAQPMEPPAAPQPRSEAVNQSSSAVNQPSAPPAAALTPSNSLQMPSDAASESVNSVSDRLDRLLNGETPTNNNLSTPINTPVNVTPAAASPATAPAAAPATTKPAAKPAVRPVPAPAAAKPAAKPNTMTTQATKPAAKPPAKPAPTTAQAPAKPPVTAATKPPVKPATTAQAPAKPPVKPAAKPPAKPTTAAQQPAKPAVAPARVVPQMEPEVDLPSGDSSLVELTTPVPAPAAVTPPAAWEATSVPAPTPETVNVPAPAPEVVTPPPAAPEPERTMPAPAPQPAAQTSFQPDRPSGIPTGNSVLRPPSMARTFAPPFSTRLSLLYNPVSYKEDLAPQDLQAAGSITQAFGAEGSWRMADPVELAGSYVYNSYRLDRETGETNTRSENQARLMGYYVLPLNQNLELGFGGGAMLSTYATSGDAPAAGRSQDLFDSSYQRVMLQTEAKVGYQPLRDQPLTLLAAAGVMPWGTVMQSQAMLPSNLWGLSYSAGARYTIMGIAIEARYMGQQIFGDQYQQGNDVFRLGLGYEFR